MYACLSCFPGVCCRNIACSAVAETCRCLLILVSLPGPTGKGGFGCCHSGVVEIESARDLSMCLNPVAFSSAVCLFAFGCVLQYLPDSVLELTGSCRTLVSLYFIMTVLLHTVGSLEAAWLWLFLCFNRAVACLPVAVPLSWWLWKTEEPSNQAKETMLIFFQVINKIVFF